MQCVHSITKSLDISLISEAVLSIVEWHYITAYYNKV